MEESVVGVGEVSLSAWTHRHSDTGMCTFRPGIYNCWWFGALRSPIITHTNTSNPAATHPLSAWSHVWTINTRNQTRWVEGDRNLLQVGLAPDAFTIHYPQSSDCVCQKTVKYFRDADCVDWWILCCCSCLFDLDHNLSSIYGSRVYMYYITRKCRHEL